MTARRFGTSTITPTTTNNLVMGRRPFSVIRGRVVYAEDKLYKMRGYDTGVAAYVYWYTSIPESVSPYPLAVNIVIDAIVIDVLDS